MLLRYAILGLLDGQELHGYRIKAAFEERVGPLWPLNFGQIYQTLKDLRRRGLVDGRFDRGTGHVGRWVYTITTKGRRALDTWLARAPRQPQPARDEMLIRLLVLDGKNAESRRGQLDRQARVYHQWIATLAAQRKTYEAAEGAALRVLATDAAILQAEAHLGWLAQCTKHLDRP
ncbi:MAG TPA: PadR family transcriptional regulator [Candidatus Binatia bacterium]|jgi:DNA-binding PadR family transcriptional regulator